MTTLRHRPFTCGTDGPASVAQRSALLTLFREAELDTRTITAMHTTVGISRVWVDRTVDDYLSNVGRIEASKVIGKLKERVQ